MGWHRCYNHVNQACVQHLWASRSKALYMMLLTKCLTHIANDNDGCNTFWHTAGTTTSILL
eukprot:15474115-Heterocapsa_arctica.AAC.1